VGGCTEPWQSIPPSTNTSISFPEGRRETVRAIHERVLAEVPDLDVAGELCRRAADLVAAGRFAM
jgi:hypothetical protein